MSEKMVRTISLSPGRIAMVDFLEASAGIPLVSVVRQINVRELMQVRAAAQPRPSWNSIFTKAYARVATEVPELRRHFMSWPWRRLYEHPHTRAMIAVEADIDGEKVVVPAQVEQPENMDLLALDQNVIEFKHDPMKSKSFRRSLLVARLPRLARKLLWWLATGWSGYRRARTLGTFAMTSVAFAGAEAVAIVTPLPNLLHYGLVDEAGNIRVMLVFDHRIMDGVVPSRALVRMEEILQTEILHELRGLRAHAAA
jgi:hypothetical protein